MELCFRTTPSEPVKFKVLDIKKCYDFRGLCPLVPLISQGAYSSLLTLTRSRDALFALSEFLAKVEFHPCNMFLISRSIISMDVM